MSSVGPAISERQSDISERLNRRSTTMRTTQSLRSSTATTTPESLGSSHVSRCLSGDSSVSKRDLVILLHRAEMKAVRASVKLFLSKHGFKEDDVNHKKRTHWGTAFTYPLHVATVNLDEATVRMLLKLNADVAAVDSAGNTAFRCLQRHKRQSCCHGTGLQEPSAARILDYLEGWKSGSPVSYPLVSHDLFMGA
mmetsp:Transcript_52522/g.94208  ORF Transcript_52522/g.94208 Transcript_52522/m.94208 type:complete len:195 (+) Transcript_52522:41-625(+)